MFQNGSLGQRGGEKKVKKKRRVRRKRQLRTPAPVHGRKHMETQTSRYLEEIHVHPTEATMCTQTDPMLDYPEPPLFVPQASGVSVSTQIEDGDLFDFNLEVIPLLETLVGKALDIAMMEACEEQELKALRQHQEMYEQRRNAELTECQRLQETERRLFEEKERRKQQARKFQEEKKKEEMRLAAKLLVKEKQQDLKDITFSRLRKKGVFGEEPLMNFLSKTFMKGVYEQVGELLKPKTVSVDILNALIEHVAESLLQKKINSINEIKAELNVRKQKEEELLRLRTTYGAGVDTIANVLDSIKEEPYFAFELSALLSKEEDSLGEFVESLSQGGNFSKQIVESLPLENTEADTLKERIASVKKYQTMYDLRSEARNMQKVLSEVAAVEIAPLLEALGVESVEDLSAKFMTKACFDVPLLKKLNDFVAKRQSDQAEENAEEVQEEN